MAIRDSRVQLFSFFHQSSQSEGRKGQSNLEDLEMVTRLVSQPGIQLLRPWNSEKSGLLGDDGVHLSKREVYLQS